MTDEKREAHRLARNAWCDTYQIVSARGRYYSRNEVRAKAWQRVKNMTLAQDKIRSLIEALLNDEAWMTARRGYLPGALARELADEAMVRYFLTPPGSVRTE